MQKIILSNGQEPGDVLMLTAAVRDLHRCQPEKFLVDVRTPYPALWENNPWISPLDLDDPEARTIECHYPLILQSNDRPYHFLHGFTQYLSDWLGIKIVPMKFKADIHLAGSERRPSVLSPLLPVNFGPYWLVSAGGKRDFTIKWWSRERFQEVVDALKHEIRFVQVGRSEDCHPPLTNVVDLRGRTDLRQLIALVHHSAGVLTPVSLPMHLAAAVETVPGAPASRPCVVVAGGREPPHWEAYPTHQFIHTIGTLDCCREGGCWRSRTVPLGDRDVNDTPMRLCVDVVGSLPRCMDMITPEMVVERVRMFTGSRRSAP